MGHRVSLGDLAVPDRGGWAGSDSAGAAGSVVAVTMVFVILQVLLSLALVFLVLVHSGKGGGLSDMFGGGLGASAAGSTVMEKNLDRITVAVAVAFVFCTLTLALLLDA